MARLEDIPEATRIAAAELPCPSFETTPFVAGPKLAKRRVAIISSAGLLHRGARPFARPLHDGEGECRAVPSTWHARDILVSHASVNFDRTGFQRDINVVFPIDRLRDLAAAGDIGSVAETHFTFIPVADPTPARIADEMAAALHSTRVDGVILVPI
jgi:D-proline reductase (dithiol) PrdB